MENISKTELETKIIVEIGKRFLPKMKQDLVSYIDASFIKYKRNNQELEKKLDNAVEEIDSVISSTINDINQGREKLRNLTYEELKKIVQENSKELVNILINEIKSDEDLKMSFISAIMD